MQYPYGYDATITKHFHYNIHSFNIRWLIIMARLHIPYFSETNLSQSVNEVNVQRERIFRAMIIPGESK